MKNHNLKHFYTGRSHLIFSNPAANVHLRMFYFAKRSETLQKLEM